MLTIAGVVVGGLVFLTGVSIYSALCLAKRTDEIIEEQELEDEDRPIIVRFPEECIHRARPMPTRK